MDKYLRTCIALATASLLTACGDDTFNYSFPEEEAPQPPVVEKPTPVEPAPVTPEPAPPVKPSPTPRCEKGHRDCEDSDD